MNVKLLRKVAKEIEKEPRKINMDTILRPVWADEPKPSCGTVGCIAGWACQLSGVTQGRTSMNKAKELLGIDSDQAQRLFEPPQVGDYDPDHPYMIKDAIWPKKFGLRYAKAKTPRGRMLATVARIEHFIRTKGAE